MLLLAIQNAGTPENSIVAATVRTSVEWLRLAAELVGAAIIGLGVVLAFVGFIRALALRQAAAFTDVRLQLGRYLALALEFELGADILSTAVSPSWDQIGKLGAIAVIRTASTSSSRASYGRLATRSRAPRAERIGRMRVGCRGTAQPNELRHWLLPRPPH